MPASVDEFFLGRDWPALEAATGWKVSRDRDDPERVLLDVGAKDGERYFVQFLCDGYPGLAPSVLFVNVIGSQADPTAWPYGDSVFFEEIKPPPNCFVCMPLTREGLKHHPNWLTAGVGTWDPDVHTLMDLFNHMHRLLNGKHYLGRGGR